MNWPQSCPPMYSSPRVTQRWKARHASNKVTAPSVARQRSGAPSTHRVQGWPAAARRWYRAVVVPRAPGRGAGSTRGAPAVHRACTEPRCTELAPNRGADGACTEAEKAENHCSQPIDPPRDRPDRQAPHQQCWCRLSPLRAQGTPNGSCWLLGQQRANVHERCRQCRRL